jgi:hypothetical protein
METDNTTIELNKEFKKELLIDNFNEHNPEFVEVSIKKEKLNPKQIYVNIKIKKEKKFLNFSVQNRKSFARLGMNFSSL